MEKMSKTEIKVGLFVLVSTIFTIMFIVALGEDSGLLSRSARFKLVMEDTQGLMVGSIIKISGLPSGNVSEITFDGDSNKVVLDLSIRKNLAARLTKGTTISVYTQGALGDKYISITPGPFTAQPIEWGSEIPMAPATDIFSTIGNSGDRIAKLFDILEQMDTFMKNLNDGNVSGNLAEMTKNLRLATAQMNQTFTSINGEKSGENKMGKAVDHMASIMEKIDNGQGSLGGLINDPTIHEDLKALLGGAKRNKLLKYLIRQTIQKSSEEPIVESSSK